MKRRFCAIQLTWAKMQIDSGVDLLHILRFPRKEFFSPNECSRALRVLQRAHTAVCPGPPMNNLDSLKHPLLPAALSLMAIESDHFPWPSLLRGVGLRLGPRLILTLRRLHPRQQDRQVPFSPLDFFKCLAITQDQGQLRYRRLPPNLLLPILAKHPGLLR